MTKLPIKRTVLMLGLAICATPGRTADEAAIGKLIEQLGSAEFSEREKASTELNRIGTPALEALRKATKSDDPEVRRRAEDLVGVLERQAATEKVLAPKKVRLQLKETPLPDAVATLKKQSGYEVVLHDPEGKLRSRTVTLDSGDVTFWEAVDLLCLKAGLVEIEPKPAAGVVPRPQPAQGPGAIAPRPVRELLPLPAERAPAVRPATEPVPGAKAAPAPALPIPGGPAPVQDKRLVEEEPVAKPAPAPALPVQIQGIRVLPAQIAVAQPVFQGIMPVRPQAVMPVQGPLAPLTLGDGKPRALPTAYAGTLRIRPVVPENDNAPADRSTIQLRFSLEPRLQWAGIFNLRIEKASDSDGKALSASGPQDPNMNLANPAAVRIRAPVTYSTVSAHQVLPINLGKQLRSGDSLKELTAVLTALVRSKPEAFISADEIVKAGGKVFKGAEGGSIKVVEVKDSPNDTLTIRVELNPPENVLPANHPGIYLDLRSIDLPLGPRPQIRIQPALPKQIIPVPAPQQDVDLPKGALQGPPAAPGVGGAVAPAARIARPWRAAGYQGLTLLDTQGNPMPFVGVGTSVIHVNGVLQRTLALTYKVQKGQPAPDKLVFFGAKQSKVEVPFTLKNVPVE